MSYYISNYRYFTFIFVLVIFFNASIFAGNKGLRLGDVFKSKNEAYKIGGEKVKITDSVVKGKVNVFQFCALDCPYCIVACLVLTGNHKLVDEQLPMIDYGVANGADPSDMEYVFFPPPDVPSQLPTGVVFRDFFGFLAGGPVAGPPYPVYQAIVDEYDINYVEMMAQTSFARENATGSLISSESDAIVYGAYFGNGKVDLYLHDNEDPEAEEKGIRGLLLQSFNAYPSFVVTDKKGRIVAMPAGQSTSFWTTGERGDDSVLYYAIRYAAGEDLGPVEPNEWINELIGFVQFNTIVVDENGEYVSGVFSEETAEGLLIPLERALKRLDKGKNKPAANRLETFLRRFQKTLNAPIDEDLLGDEVLSSRGDAAAIVWIDTNRLVDQLRDKKKNK